MLADGADQWAPLVQAEFDDFVGRYTRGERRTAGQRRVVGAFSSDQVDALQEAGQLRAAGARGTIHVDMAKLRNLLGEGQRTPAQATDTGVALVAQLPTLLRQVGEAWLDGDRAVLLCTSDSQRVVKIVVDLTGQAGGKAGSNGVVSMEVIDPASFDRAGLSKLQ